MGQLPKSKIEQLKREKREAKAAKKRKVATRNKIVRFLIVCEGERTEPNYFKEFAGVKGYNRIEVSIKNISGLSV